MLFIRRSRNNAAGVRFPAGERDFSLLHSVQTGSGAHISSCPMDTVDSFPGGKEAGVVKLTTHLHLVLPSFFSTLQLRVSFGLLNSLPTFFDARLII
jgi:hypothetical protein